MLGKKRKKERKNVLFFLLLNNNRNNNNNNDFSTAGNLIFLFFPFYTFHTIQSTRKVKNTQDQDNRVMRGEREKELKAANPFTPRWWCRVLLIPGNFFFSKKNKRNGRRKKFITAQLSGGEKKFLNFLFNFLEKEKSKRRKLLWQQSKARLGHITNGNATTPARWVSVINRTTPQSNNQGPFIGRRTPTHKRRRRRIWRRRKEPTE